MDAVETAPRRARMIHNSGYLRVARDFYATPGWVTERLLDQVRLREAVWEPCCGDGAMARVLAARGYQVVASDIADRGFGAAGLDFLAATAFPAGCGALVTNPPYGEADVSAGKPRSSAAMQRFLRHALALTAAVEGQLALLVRLQWLAGQRAAAIMSAAPFAKVIVLRDRITWFDLGAETKRAQHHHAWVVIDHHHPPGAPPVLLYG